MTNAGSFAGAIRAANDRLSSSRQSSPVGGASVDISDDPAVVAGRARDDRPPTPRRGEQPTQRIGGKVAWPVVLFMGGLLIPWIISIAGTNLFVYRIVLLLTIIPCGIMWMSGRAGMLRLADFGVIGFSLWAALSLLVVHGMGKGLQSAGILVVETVGPYLLARIYIRSREDFRSMASLAVAGIFLLLPFALVEWVTGTKPLLSIFGLVFPTVEPAVIPRAGFYRVQGPFDHSIIFGVNCASVLTFAFLVLKTKTARKILTIGGISFATLVSMSSAPIASFVIQIALLSWNRIFRAYPLRWMILLGFAFAGFLVVEFGSNQTPIQFYISHFTFDQQTGWYRLSIWEHGSASVLAHPLFGIGLNDWVRPAWMHSDSVDNFWLLLAMRHGLPALLLLAFSIASLIFGLISKKGLDAELGDYRVAVVMCLVVYVFLGSTVHLWNATYAWFFFLLGSCVWILDAKPQEGAEVPRTTRSRDDMRRLSGSRPMRTVPERARN